MKRKSIEFLTQTYLCVGPKRGAVGTGFGNSLYMHACKWTPKRCGGAVIV